MNEAVLKSILHKVRGVGGKGMSKDVRPEPTPSETLAAAVLVENTPDEASSILTAWRELFGVRLDRAKVTNQLNAQRQWQDQWRDYRSRGNSEE